MSRFACGLFLALIFASVSGFWFLVSVPVSLSVLACVIAFVIAFVVEIRGAFVSSMVLFIGDSWLVSRD